VGNGVNIHKTCANEYNNAQNQVTQPEPNNLSLELAQQQIRDLRNK
jgi:hypothetical protein|tara:strand:+ start:1230 stop:1367 length:138 start_codon:yes stop_codon:yes gene_type:complete